MHGNNSSINFSSNLSASPGSRCDYADVVKSEGKIREVKKGFGWSMKSTLKDEEVRKGVAPLLTANLERPLAAARISVEHSSIIRPSNLSSTSSSSNPSDIVSELYILHDSACELNENAIFTIDFKRRREWENRTKGAGKSHGTGLNTALWQVMTFAHATKELWFKMHLLLSMLLFYPKKFLFSLCCDSSTSELFFLDLGIGNSDDIVSVRESILKDIRERINPEDNAFNSFKRRIVQRHYSVTTFSCCDRHAWARRVRMVLTVFRFIFAVLFRIAAFPVLIVLVFPLVCFGSMDSRHFFLAQVLNDWFCCGRCYRQSDADAQESTKKVTMFEKWHTNHLSETKEGVLEQTGSGSSSFQQCAGHCFEGSEQDPILANPIYQTHQKLAASKDSFFGRNKCAYFHDSGNVAKFVAQLILLLKSETDRKDETFYMTNFLHNDPKRETMSRQPFPALTDSFDFSWKKKIEVDARRLYTEVTKNTADFEIVYTKEGYVAVKPIKSSSILHSGKFHMKNVNLVKIEILMQHLKSLWNTNFGEDRG